MGAAEFIDTHTHLCAEEFDGDRAEVVERSAAAGIIRLIDVGSGYGRDSAARAVINAETFANVYAAVGLHPCDSGTPFSLEFLRELLPHPKVVAVGETGLDYYWMKDPKDKQERWFRAQIELALEFKKPLIIHSREAAQDCFRILKEMGAEACAGVFHCYPEDQHFAALLREMSFLVSVPGTLTFRKAEKMRAIFREIPLSQIMLETDAPFLAPQPWRGNRCESCYLLETASVLAAIRGISLEEVARITTDNARRLFRL